MAKIVRIPLVMANGAKATDMKSLKDNFDAESVVRYFLEGKLEKWLSDRYYEDEAERIAALDKDDPSLAQKLCEVFGVEYSGADFDPEEVARRAERLARLRQLTDDEEALRSIDAVAFDQEELAELYDAGVRKIYLCEGEFRIPKSKRELEYVLLGGAKADGIAEPVQEAAIDISVSEPEYQPPVSEPSIAALVEEKLGRHLKTESALFRTSIDNASMSSASQLRYYDDGIHSSSEAERRAESKFSSLFSSLQSNFNTSSSHSLAKKATEELMTLVKHDLLEITDAIAHLPDDIKGRNSSVINELLTFIDPSNLTRRIRNLADNELDDNYYELSDLSYYLGQIDYSESEAYGGGFFSKSNWSYNGTDSWIEAVEDARKLAEDYFKFMSSEFRREIITPIMDLAKRIK